MKSKLLLKRFLSVFCAITFVVSTSVTLSACKSGSNVGGNLPTLKYYIMQAGSAAPAELAKVQDAVNKLVSSKVGANIELHALSLTEVTSKVPLMLSSGDDFDLVSVSGSFCSYATQQQTGGLLALDTLLPSATPTLYKTYDTATWNAAKIKGQIYMVPSYNPGVGYAGVWVPKDLTDKYSFDWQKPTSFEGWEPFFDNILKSEPGVTPVTSTDAYWGRLWFPQYYGYDSIPGVSAPKGQPLVVVKADDTSRKVIAAPFTDDYKANVTLARKWYLKGYMAKTPPTEDQFGILKKTGKVATFVVPFVGEWDTTGMGASEWNGKTILQAKIAGKKNIIGTGSVIGSGTAIAKVSKHPKEALKFIEQMFTNAELENLLNWGIEGTDWVWSDKANKVIAMPAGVTADNAKYYPNTSWQFGDCTLSYFTSASGKDVLGKVQNDIKNDSIKSVIMGFSPDPSSLKTEIANVSNVAQEYGEPLEKGLIDPNDPVKGLAAFQKKLKDAGIDTIIKTYQDQVNAWATQNTK